MNTENLDIFAAISEILVEILDLAPQEITPEAYLMRDLGVESIDLMELAVSLNECFNMSVDEELIFLKPLRAVMDEAHIEQKKPAEAVAKTFFFLPPERIAQMLQDLADGPVLKVKDVEQYIRFSLHAQGAQRAG